MTVRTAADRARRLERQILVATQRETQHETQHENGDGVDTWLADMEHKLAAADGAPER